jgi:PAS domain S-box-containing protein
MNELTVGLLGLGFLIHTFFIGRKAISRKDYGQFARMIPRIYTFIACMVYIYSPTPTDESIIHVGIGLVIIADIFIALIESIGNKYYDSKQVAELTYLLERTHNKYVTIIENSQVGFYITDNNGILEFANKALLKLFGCKGSEIIGKKVFDFVADNESRELIKTHLANKMLGKEKESCYQVNFINARGEVVRVQISSVRTDNGHPTTTGSVILVDSQNCDVQEG